MPPFSGADPVLKDEASCEQWVWQAKEALKSCTAGTVRIVIIQLVQEEVREFTTAVGFEESVETLLEKVEDRFGEKWTADGLQQDSYKTNQGKNERVRQFAGRLEAQFKKLKEKVQGCYDNSMLRNTCFMGCTSNLRIPSGFATRGRRPPMKSSSEKLQKLRKKRIQKQSNIFEG